MSTEEGIELVDSNIQQNISPGPIQYEIKDKPSFQETRALFIGNLQPYHDTDTFKKILLTEVENENCSIERAWLNSSRSHCFLLASDVTGARAIRLRLNGKNFVNNDSEENSTETDNGDKVYVDYIPVRAILTWIEQEKEAPIDAIWKIVYEDKPSIENVGTTFKSVSHIMVNYDNRDTGYVKIKRNRRNYRKEDIINSKSQRRYDPRIRGSRNISFKNSKYVANNNDHYNHHHDHHHHNSHHHSSGNYGNYHPRDDSNRSSYQPSRRNRNNYYGSSDTYVPSY